MEYNFTEDILDIIKQKTTNLFNKLEEAYTEVRTVSERYSTVECSEKNVQLDNPSPESAVTRLSVQLYPQTQDFLEDFKLFHNDSRANITLLKYIIHKKLRKIEKSDKIILFNDLKEFENNQEITELIWDYIHSVYLLHEYALPEPNKEILSALIKKINVEEEVENENNNSLTVIDENNYEEDIFEKIKDKKEFKMFNDILGSITKNMDIDPSKANTTFINDIMDDIKTNINNSEGIDDLFNSTKNIGEKYKNMFEDGKFNMNDLMSSMMNIMSNPKNISETIKDIDVKKLPDMNSIMNKLVTEVQSSDDIKNMMNSDMLKNMNFDPNNKDFNPMDIISNMMNGVSNKETDENQAPLTEEQIIEMENFYSNLNIGNEQEQEQEQEQE
jgi:hypothetical protein